MTSRLASFIEEEVVIVGIEPSAILTFRDEYQRLLPNQPLVQKLKNQTFLIEEFLAKAFENQSFRSFYFSQGICRG